MTRRRNTLRFAFTSGADPSYVTVNRWGEVGIYLGSVKTHLWHPTARSLARCIERALSAWGRRAKPKRKGR
jgi:hypothetical protein